jgi:hypothetical protein
MVASSTRHLPSSSTSNQAQLQRIAAQVAEHRQRGHLTIGPFMHLATRTFHLMHVLHIVLSAFCSAHSARMWHRRNLRTYKCISEQLPDEDRHSGSQLLSQAFRHRGNRHALLSWAPNSVRVPCAVLNNNTAKTPHGLLCNWTRENYAFECMIQQAACTCNVTATNGKPYLVCAVFAEDCASAATAALATTVLQLLK